MGILTKLYKPSEAKSSTAPQAITAMDAELIRWMGNPTASGKPVTEESALRIGVAWACIRLLSETIGALPWAIFRRGRDGTAERADDHPLSDVLIGSPNAEQTSVEYREVLVANLCANGNSYSFRENAGSRVASLRPLRSSDVQPLRKRGSNTRLALSEDEIFFRFNDRGRPEDLPRDKVWHVKGFGLQDLQGLSPVGAARETMGLALAAEEFGSRFFSQGGMPAGTVTIPGWLDELQREKARLNLQQMLGGLGNAHKFALFEGGMKPEPWGEMNLEDMQFILLRKFSVEEICRFYRVPPHMVALLDRATFSNIEHMSQDFVAYTLIPYLTRFESSVAKWLMRPADRGSFFLRFNFEGLLRADSKGRSEFYASALQNGWMNRNEVRAKENLNRVDGLDDYTVQSNMALFDQLAELAASKVAPSPEIPA